MKIPFRNTPGKSSQAVDSVGEGMRKEQRRPAYNREDQYGSKCEILAKFPEDTGHGFKRQRKAENNRMARSGLATDRIVKKVAIDRDTVTYRLAGALLKGALDFGTARVIFHCLWI